MNIQKALATIQQDVDRTIARLNLVPAQVAAQTAQRIEDLEVRCRLLQEQVGALQGFITKLSADSETTLSTLYRARRAAEI